MLSYFAYKVNKTNIEMRICNMQLSNKSTDEIIRYWLSIFTDFGVPLKVVSDNNTFNSYKTSSSLHPNSNGLAERAV